MSVLILFQGPGSPVYARTHVYICVFVVYVYGMCVYAHVCVMFNLYYTLARLLRNLSLHC